MIESILDELLAVGSYLPNNKKAEILSPLTNTWTSVSDYPYGMFYNFLTFPKLIKSERSYLPCADCLR